MSKATEKEEARKRRERRRKMESRTKNQEQSPELFDSSGERVHYKDEKTKSKLPIKKVILVLLVGVLVYKLLIFQILHLMFFWDHITLIV